MTRDEVAQLLRDEFRDMTKALSGVFSAMTSDERHRKIALAGTTKRRAEVLSMLESRSPSNALSCGEKTIEFLALVALAGGDFTSTEWREAIDHVLKCEPVIADACALPFGSPYATIAEAFWEPFAAVLSHIAGRPTPLINESAKAVTEMVQDLGAQFLIALFRSHQLSAGPDDLTAVGRLNNAINALER